jgi:hypothetical protein
MEKNMSDHLDEIKKLAKNPVNEAALAGIEKPYKLVMMKADTRYVAASDQVELDRVRENFLKKKLGLTGDLDGAIKSVAETMKGINKKSRVTFYYLLAEHFNKLDAFVK